MGLALRREIIFRIDSICPIVLLRKRLVVRSGLVGWIVFIVVEENDIILIVLKITVHIYK